LAINALLLDQFRLWRQDGALQKTVRDRPTVTVEESTGSHHQAIQGPISNSYDHPFPQTGGSQPPVETSSLQEHTISLHNNTVIETPLPQKGQEKNNIQML